MKCTVYELNHLKNYKCVIIFARYKNKWIICKHKDRNTWETSGGHIEAGEIPIEAAKRELWEETGAIDFDIEPICDYWACREPHETEKYEWENRTEKFESEVGQVFFAKVYKLKEIPQNSEMECVDFFNEFPQNLTYPDITNELLSQIITKI